MRIVFFLALLIGGLAHAASGELGFFVFKNGVPVAGVQVVIDEDIYVTTDADGALYYKLNAGTHRLMVNVFEGTTHVAHAKQTFTIAPEQNTEIILNLEANGTMQADVEASSEAQNYVQTAPVETGDTRSFSAVLVSKEDKKPIQNARIFVKGSIIQALSDAQGAVTLALPEGNYTLSVVHDKFTNKTFTITLDQTKQEALTVELSPAGMELQEFVVLVPQVEGSIAAVLTEKRNELGVTEVMGSEQMSKAGDSKATDALKRVTGVTIVDGKYVYVRGLGERYTTVTLNGFYLPSPDPTKRVVPLDIFPTGVLSSIKIQKTAQANKNSEFAGGLVELRTKTIPEEFFFKFSMSATYDDESTMREGDTYKGGKLDFLGYDDGTRALPQEVLDATQGDSKLSDLSTNELIEVTKATSFENKTYKKTYLPNTSFAFSLGDSFEITKEQKLGYYFATAYQYSNDITDYERVIYATNENRDMIPTTTDDYTVSKQGYSLSSMFGLGYSYGDDHTLSWNNLYIHQADDIVRQSHFVTQNERRYLTTLNWQEQTLLTSQLLGEHHFGEHEIKWRTAYSLAKLDEPDRRTYGFMYETPGSPLFLSQFNSEKLARMYNTLVDNSLDSAFDYTLPLPSWTKEDNKLHLGGSMVFKDRDSRFRTFNYRQSSGNAKIFETNIDEIINADTLGTDSAQNQFTLHEVGLNTGDYIGTQQLYAGYGMLDVSLLERLFLNVGLRYEYSAQRLRIFSNQTGLEFLNGAAENITSDMLPSLLLTYKLHEDMQLRLGYSRTMSRPNFKELSQVIVLDPNTMNPYIGNKDLLSASIDNLDVRYEWYFSSTESFSIAGFAKNFKNPIEDVLLPSSDGELFSFDNANSAFNYGYEIDVLKKLGNWGSVDLNDMFVALNYSYIISQVDVAGMTVEDGGILTNVKRPMQGQSPYVFNVSTGYDDQDRGISATIMYNIFGKRIVRVGTNSRPDQYEEPVGRLDFVFLADVSENLKVTFKAMNLLNPVHQVTQGDAIAFEYTNGRRYTMGLSYKY